MSLTFDLDKPKKSEADIVLLLAFQAARDKIIKHYEKNNWVYYVSLNLDPRHKMKAFDLTVWGKELKSTSYKTFIKILRKEKNIVKMST